VPGATKTKWQLKREASHEAIVHSAMRRFAELGYAQTRVDDIVESTGYSKGAFYFHFANKLECFWDVIAYREELRGDWVAHVTADLDPAAPLDQVLARTFAYLAEADQGVGSWVLVMVGFRQQHRDDEGVQAQLAAVYAGWRLSVARFVAALQEAGLVAADKDADLLATEVFAYVEGLMAHGSLYGVAADTALLDGVVKLLGGSRVAR
jgi:AcrR family transcriptional regulator